MRKKFKILGIQFLLKYDKEFGLRLWWFYKTRQTAIYFTGGEVFHPMHIYNINFNKE